MPTADVPPRAHEGHPEHAHTAHEDGFFTMGVEAAFFFALGYVAFYLVHGRSGGDHE